MKALSQMSNQELKDLHSGLVEQFEAAKASGLKLDMSRGKPTPAQLDMSMDLMDVLNSGSDMKDASGVDVRNYGGLEGIMEARELMGEMLGVPAKNVLMGGNASLTLMYDAVARSMSFGVLGSTPWCKLDSVKWLCPAPGYDRHFKITQLFGIEMITIPMLPTGPDMDLVEKYVNTDPSVKGIWCVPKYSNPQGISYSDETVRRFAALKPAAEDFRIYWDNAYCVHDLYPDHPDTILEILSECEKAGNPNMVFEFASTSKVSFAGAGISCVASSEENLAWIKKTMTVQSISNDKVNQLRHARYFKNMAGIQKKMAEHANSMRPKFEAVLATFERDLEGLEIGSWTKPNGGYFISFESMEGCAKAIVAKCKEAGVTLTGAGATYPYGVDPKDTNIRIAPSYPTAEEMAQAATLFVLCVKLVSVEKLLGMN